MRIDDSNPVPPAAAQPAARNARQQPAPAAANPVVKDHLEVHTKPAVSPTSVLVEMHPGNIVVYKFIDEASGRLIQQIPSEQMISLSEVAQTNEKSPKQK